MSDKDLEIVRLREIVQKQEIYIAELEQDRRDLMLMLQAQEGGEDSGTGFSAQGKELSLIGEEEEEDDSTFY